MQADAQITEPTAAEMDAALVFTAHGYSDADGVDHVTVAERAVRAAEPAMPWPSAARAMVALTRQRAALHGGRDWAGLLAARNDLVDFINRTSLARPLDADVTDLDLAGDYADEIENTISTDRTAASARARLALCLRLNDEGFEVGERIAELLPVVAALAPDEVQPVSFNDADAPARWTRVLAGFQAIEDENEAASMAHQSYDDFAKNHHMRAEFDTVYAAWRQGRSVLMETPAPHWEALATKVRLVRGMFDCQGRWDKAAAAFLSHAEKLGAGDPAQADLIQVMGARGCAEQIAYFLAHRLDGYAEWAANWTVVSRLAAEAELIIRESRDLASLRSDHQAMSGEIISAVWFSEPPKIDCEVSRLSDEWSTALRTQHRLDAKAERTDREQADLLAAEARLSDLNDEVFEHLPRTRAGVAFQLLVAAGRVPHVRHAVTDEAKALAEKNIVSAITNAIRVLGLPFDYRAGPYFVGPDLDDLDGRDIGEGAQ